MRSKIVGTVAQTAQLALEKGEQVWASKGSIVSHSPGLSWDVRVPGGLSAGLKRSLSGEGISLTLIEATADGQEITLGAGTPGHVAEWTLETDGPVLTTRGSFLAASGSALDISVSVARRVGAVFFGGAGLVLQRIGGEGTVLVHARGDLRRIVLSEDDRLLVSTGNLAAFSDSVSYDVRAVGSLRKSLFGKEGLFMTSLVGPGTVLVQSLKASAGPQRE